MTSIQQNQIKEWLRSSEHGEGSIYIDMCRGEKVKLTVEWTEQLEGDIYTHKEGRCKRSLGPCGCLRCWRLVNKLNLVVLLHVHMLMHDRFIIISLNLIARSIAKIQNQLTIYVLFDQKMANLCCTHKFLRMWWTGQHTSTLLTLSFPCACSNGSNAIPTRTNN